MRLSIGQMATASGLTVKRLRHYHDRGVLVAASTDPVTGYRGYDPDQVTSAVLVRRLRDSGVGLDQVAEILRTPARREELVVAALERTRTELERARERVDEAARLLAAPVEVAVAVRRIPDQWVLSRSGELSCVECPEWFGAAYAELATRLQGPANGPAGAVYGPAFFAEDRGPVRVHLPVGAGTPGAELLPGGVFAVAVHDGSYDNFSVTYAALGAQVHRAHVPIAEGEVREHYLIGPAETPDPHRWRSEVCWPIES